MSKGGVRCRREKKRYLKTHHKNGSCSCGPPQSIGGHNVDRPIATARSRNNCPGNVTARDCHKRARRSATRNDSKTDTTASMSSCKSTPRQHQSKLNLHAASELHRAGGKVEDKAHIRPTSLATRASSSGWPVGSMQSQWRWPEREKLPGLAFEIARGWRSQNTVRSSNSQHVQSFLSVAGPCCHPIQFGREKSND